MSCLGVHFALTEDEVAQLRSFDDEQERLDYLQEVIEETYFTSSPEWKAESDKAWDAMHRTLADGRLTWDGGQYPLNHTVLAGESLYGDTDAYIMSLKSPQQVRDIAAALPGITEDEFHRRYFAIDTESYGFPMSDQDFRYTWDWFQEVRDLYIRAAAEGRFVLFALDQ
ncbi:MAG: YfbM family protein [Planctomycetaceae bacterium]